MGQYPFHRLREDLKVKAQKSGRRYTPMMIIDAIKGGYRIPQEKICPNAVWTLIKKCWHDVPEDRPTFSQLVQELAKVASSQEVPRDLGKLMNGELSEEVRRATMVAVERRATIVKNKAKKSAQLDTREYL